MLLINKQTKQAYNVIIDENTNSIFFDEMKRWINAKFPTSQLQTFHINDLIGDTEFTDDLQKYKSYQLNTTAFKEEDSMTIAYNLTFDIDIEQPSDVFSRKKFIEATSDNRIRLKSIKGTARAGQIVGFHEAE